MTSHLLTPSTDPIQTAFSNLPDGHLVATCNQPALIFTGSYRPKQWVTLAIITPPDGSVEGGSIHAQHAEVRLTLSDFQALLANLTAFERQIRGASA